MKAVRSFVLIPVLLGAGAVPMPALAVSDDNPYKNIILNREEELPYDDSKDVPWQEQEIAMPEIYEKKDLEEVAITRIQKGFSVLVDKKRLSIGEDGVIRYWVVLKSNLGSVNAMYEGMRCDSAEYKTYAFVVDKKTIKPMKRPQWQKIGKTLGNNFRWELMQDYFCYYNHPKPVEQIVQGLEAGPAIGPTHDADTRY